MRAKVHVVSKSTRILRPRAQHSQSAKKPSWAARVNGAEISKRELDDATRRARRHLIDAGKKSDDDATRLERLILARLIDERLLAAHVASTSQTLSPPDLDAQIRQHVADLGGEEALDAYLRAEGLERIAWERLMRRDALLDAACTVDTIDAPTLREHYTDLTGLPATRDEYEVASFLVPLLGQAPEKAHATLEKLTTEATRIDSANAFKALGQRYGARFTPTSWASATTLTPDLKVSLEESPHPAFVVESPLGALVYFRSNVRSMPTPGFVDAREVLARSERDRRCAAERDALLAELRAEARIEYPEAGKTALSEL